MKKLTGVMLCVVIAVSLGPEKVIAYDDFSEDDVAALLSVRPLMFGGSSLQAALLQWTIDGSQPPVFGYDAADRVIISWKIKDQMADDFKKAIGLPHGMSLAKISSITTQRATCCEDKCVGGHSEKSYFMLVEISNKERYIEGTKIEWKTFVAVDGDPVPRILRFDFQDSGNGVDLIDVVNRPAETVQWRIKAGLASGLFTDGEHSLEVTIPLKLRKESSEDRSQAFLRKDLCFTEEYLTAAEHVYSNKGPHSRYYYDGSSTAAAFFTVHKNMSAITNTFPWSEYVGEVHDIVMPAGKQKYLVQPIGIPVPKGSRESILFARMTMMILSGAEQKDVLKALQRAEMSENYATLYYGVLDLYQALDIYTGQELPKMVFSLKKRPMAVFINFEIPEDKIAPFKNEFLPSHFEPVRMRFYPEQEKAVYAVSLNIYESVGQNIDGFRAEWSTYVINPNEHNPKPRFSVIEAQTSGWGFDPLFVLETIEKGLYDPEDLTTLLEDPSDLFVFSLDRREGLSVSILDIQEDIEVQISIAYPDKKRMLRTRPLKSWMEANDFVYWGEAADILKYDSNVVFADLIVFKAGLSDVVFDTTFKEYIHPEPLPIIFWNGRQDIALEPWGNIEDIIVNP